VSDDLPDGELVQVLRGQDAIVVIFAGSNSDLQIRFTDAAARAGVQRFIPADFGSRDSSSSRASELVPLYQAKQKVRQHLEQLASGSSQSSSRLSWTSPVCGYSFDYRLKSGLLQFDIDARLARILDSREIKWSVTTIETIATAVVSVLQKEGETKNRMLYIQSFYVTQNEVLKSLERVTSQSWQVENVDSEEYIREARVRLDQRDPKAQEDLVSALGLVDAN
jgi:hypothetical protein